MGAVSTALGMFTLWGMQWIDFRIRRDHSALIVIATDPESPVPKLDEVLSPHGYVARFRRQTRGL